MINDTAAWKDYVKNLCLLTPKMPWSMAEAQIQLESGWRQYDALGNILSSPTGSKGLGQLNSKYYTPEQWTDPYTNLNTYVTIMKGYYAKTNPKSWRYALAAYNWGPGNVFGYTDANGVVHKPWDGTRTFTSLSAQVIKYLDIILGPGWPEPTTEVVKLFNVGDGVLQTMQANNDSPASDELYFKGANGDNQYSITFGKSGTQYTYIFSLNTTVITGHAPLQIPAPDPPTPNPTPTTVPWSLVRLVNIDSYSSPEEWPTVNPRIINGVVWHDMEGFIDGAIATWNQGNASAHLCIMRDGTIVLTVPLEDIAWHAGTDNNPSSGVYGRTAFWRAHNINPTSIGVELEGFVTSGYTQQQIDACVTLGRWLVQTYGIPTIHGIDQLEGFHMHSELSSSRSDPGSLFPFDNILSRIRP